MVAWGNIQISTPRVDYTLYYRVAHLRYCSIEVRNPHIFLLNPDIKSRATGCQLYDTKNGLKLWFNTLGRAQSSHPIADDIT